MIEESLYPLQDEVERLTRYCKLPTHIGTARIARQPIPDGDHPIEKLVRLFADKEPISLPDVEFDASFLVPVTGDCLIFLRTSADIRLSRGLHEKLAINGECADGSFELSCEQFSVESCGGGQVRWAIASPANTPAVLTFSNPNPIVRVCAIINNFDFERGNVSVAETESGRKEVLRVQACGRTVDFVPRENRERLRTLLEIDALFSTSLATFWFDAWQGASESDLASFAHHVAGFCKVVAGQHTGIPVLSFLDGNGQPVKRLIGNPVESKFRAGYACQSLHLDGGLPKLFAQCFQEFVKLDSSDLWRVLPSFCASIEDPPYLEQKYVTLMAGIELLVRNSLIEGGHLTSEQVKGLVWSDLVGEARKRMGWNIPKHYSSKDRTRLMRNAVAHGEPLPEAPSQVRHDLSKWSLFLTRRYLMRLGYDGDIASPQKGWQSKSKVDDFSEECNSFITDDE